MKIGRIVALLVLSVAVHAGASGQAYRSFAYKAVGPATLRVLAKFPERAAEGNPAIVFLHGGGWTQGSASDMAPYFDHFTDQGFIAFSVDYRLLDMGAKTIHDQIDDAKDAINWVYSQSEALHIDPQAITLCGFSAGSQLALATVMIPSKSRLSFRPKAIVLMSTPVDPWSMNFREFLKGGKDISPLNHIATQLPPMLFFQGTKDKLTDYKRVVSFVKKEKAKNVDCRLILLEGRDHFILDSSNDFASIMNSIDEFLHSL